MPASDRAGAAAARVRQDFATGVGLAAVADRRPESGSSIPVALAAAVGEARYADTVLLPADRPSFRDFAVINLLDLLRKRLSAPAA